MAAPSSNPMPGNEGVDPKDATYEPPPPYTPGSYGTSSMSPPNINDTVYPMPPPPPPPPPFGQMPSESYPLQQSVIIAQTTTTPSLLQYAFGPSPASLVCPYCSRSIVTMVRYDPGACTWAIFACLMLCLCWLCAWMPFVAKGTKDVTHSCPNCHAILGIYRRM